VHERGTAIRITGDYELARRPVWVKLLTGSNNESDYTFLGTLFPDGKWPETTFASFRPGRDCKVGPEAPSRKALDWLVEKLSPEVNGRGLFEQAEVWHEDTCGRCGRKLTVPESVESGYGPECIKRVGA